MLDTDTPRQQEQRLVLRLLNRWRELADERAMPAVADVAALADDIREDCFVLERIESDDLAFRFVGARQRAVLDSDPTGRRLSEIDGKTLLGRAVCYRAHVFERAAPVSVGGQFIDKSGQTMLYRSILLPLGDDGITALLGCVNSRLVVLE